ncbi:hypothetical protein CQW29_18380 [Pantoea coffeiphila]|uniref:DUF1799 domain-containing protein n=1 Tax=Pantoea coffeiphila TaxID=1465635 RepID=A0A2S9I846_9GAMM|nr:hypothetical protein CQW29_18380 [Pantoea coffeiphila]
MAPYGLTPDDYDDEIVEVWPDVWPAFDVLRAMSTQWRTGMNGVTGLDYNVLPWLMKVTGVEDEATAFNDIRVMERAALDVIHKGA